MARIGKYFRLCIVVILAVSSLIMVEFVSAQSIPKPSVPEFTLKIVAHQSIEVTIKNQPFTSFSANGSTVSLSYQIQIKVHYAVDSQWQYYSFDNTITPAQAGWYLSPSNSEYTVISVPSDYESGGQLDFRVRALIGYTDEMRLGQTGDMLFFHGETSDWSNTQTITIGEATNSNTPNPNPSSNPTANPTDNNSTDNSITSLLTSLALAAIIISVIIVISVLLYVRHLKRRITKPDNSTDNSTV
jgi:hypothetical protein